MKIEIVDITPELAAEWLLKNTSNRPLRASTVAHYAGQMSRGKWQQTHQGICFDSHGNLIDGQHRLSAIVMAGVTVRIMVTWLDTDVTAMGYLVDHGAKRSVSDILQVDRRQMEICRLIDELSGVLGARSARPIDELQLIHAYLQPHIVDYPRAIMHAMAAHRVGTLLAQLKSPEAAAEIQQQAIWFAAGDCCTQWWSSVEALNRTMRQVSRSHWSHSAGRIEYVIRWRTAMLNPTHRVSRITNEQLAAREVREQCREIIEKAGVQS